MQFTADDRRFVMTDRALARIVRQLLPSLLVAAMLLLGGRRRARGRHGHAFDHDQGSPVRSRRVARAAGQADRHPRQESQYIVSEFESSDLHFEKIVPVGSEGVVYVRPLQPGRYNFYDDFHHETQGFLVVP